ncbi:ATP-binding protein [Stappia sp.]|uniref:sensor histidine kinase n=1 Tax=Stappia sp. TaxID=1870903 RepID=UPI0025D2974B|nr:ATP-binding protein [Stappia sp.]
MLMRKARRHGAHLLVAGIALPAVVLVGWITFVTADRLFGAEVVTRADAILSVQSATLERQLDKFRLLPPLLAQRPDVRALIAARDRDKGERTAAIAAGMAGADEVAFLDRQGVLIATSHLVPRLAIVYPQDIGPLPFAEALEGRLGRAYRQGTPQAPGSYVFASAVRDETGVIGVVAVRVSLAEVEQAWALTPAPIVAVDADGSIVASNRAEWRGQKLGTHVQATGPRTVRQRVAGESGRSGPGGEAGAMTVRINGDDRSAPYLMVDCTLPVLDWRIAAFADLSDAVSQARKATAIAVLLMLLLSGGAWVAADRRQAALRRMRENRLSALRLERKVRSRTRDLSEANRRLAEEVREREAAEAELRSMQADLVQAAKMATLGQMSAALSHEFNQPLAAIRSTADNARLFIEREKPERALSGLDRIVGMVERMAEISRILKGFSRRAGTDLKPTAVKPALDEAVMLLSPRLKQSGASLVIDPVDPSIRVLGGHVRLEQVLLNLVANALDAVEGRADGLVRVEVRTLEDGNVVIRVADNGPGIDADVMARVFDPFFTTKDVGKGLGLGLSIAYKIVHDFSGTLVAGAAPEGGAEFTVRLRAADAALDAAQ